MRSTLSLPVPRRFDLRRAACSYGYIVLAPNRWDVATQSFQRPLRVGGRVVRVTVTQPAAARLRIACDARLSPRDAAGVKRQVSRVLRLDESFDAWWRLHPAAGRARFGRLIRSPDLFEDVVKTITGCNVSWPNTRRMNALLCREVGSEGAFPSAEQVAALPPAELAERTKVGYRAERIVRLARDLCDGAIDAAWFEDPARTGDELYDALLRIHGIGPYAAANLCQLLGHYDRIAIDTETYRHFCDTRGIARPDDPRRLHDDIEGHYAAYAPYQFLGYWFDLWRFYEAFIGRPAWRWEPDEGGTFTAAAFRKAGQGDAAATTRPRRAGRSRR